jgi:tetratricopeptide (TPR) repeat protein
MNGPKKALIYYWTVPLIGGAALLASSIFLIPRNMEISQALRHSLPASQTSGRDALTATIPPPSPPQLETVLAHADAQEIGQGVERLRDAGLTVTTAQVVHDLDRVGRAQVALDYLDAEANGLTPDLWRIRFELTRKLRRQQDALTMIEAASQRGSRVPPKDLIEAAYALDRLDMVIVAKKNAVLPALDTARALDLARRFDAMGRLDLITRLDGVSDAPWRHSDPWLAIRIARKSGQREEALRYALLLPAGQREAAREAILRDGGDTAALRALLLERASRPRADRAVIAEQLLAAGYRNDALAVLEQAATSLPASHMLSQRLLYLMGPRPAVREIGWLQGQAMRGAVAVQRGWIEQYAQRDRPQAALAFLAEHPMANRPDIQLLRLSLAQSAGDRIGATQIFSELLDQPTLTADQVLTLSAHAPDRPGPTLTGKLTERRLAVGVGAPQDVMALAWAAWNRGDTSETAERLDAYLRTNPDDPAALRLMAEVTRKTKGEDAARPWRQRALAHTPSGTREQAELLESLQRYPEAIAVVGKLANTRPNDRSLVAFKARLLIANGQPGRARKVLAP